MKRMGWLVLLGLAVVVSGCWQRETRGGGQDPITKVYIAPGANDKTGTGTKDNPVASVGRALAVAAEINPQATTVAIMAMAGAYTKDTQAYPVILPKGVQIIKDSGTVTFQAPSEGSEQREANVFVLADGAALSGIEVKDDATNNDHPSVTIKGSTSQAAALDTCVVDAVGLDGVQVVLPKDSVYPYPIAATFKSCTFKNCAKAVSILAPGAFTIRDCIFDTNATGLDVNKAACAVVVRGTQFNDTGSNDPSKSAAVLVEQGSADLGTLTEPGLNTFKGLSSVASFLKNVTGQKLSAIGNKFTPVESAATISTGWDLGGIFVSPEHPDSPDTDHPGNDATGDGTYDHPYRTFDHAINDPRVGFLGKIVAMNGSYDAKPTLIPDGVTITALHLPDRGKDKLPTVIVNLSGPYNSETSPIVMDGRPCALSGILIDFAFTGVITNAVIVRVKGRGVLRQVTLRNSSAATAVTGVMVEGDGEADLGVEGDGGYNEFVTCLPDLDDQRASGATQLQALDNWFRVAVPVCGTNINHKPGNLGWVWRYVDGQSGSCGG